MNCPVCGHENQAEAKFCSSCGNSLAVTCPSCSTVSPAGTKFCNNCGTSLQVDLAPLPSEDDALARLIPPEMMAKLKSARSGQAMAGERRTVTMLFADIKGSTSAAEQMDPEEWADLINAAFEKLIEPIYRYEGTLARLLGDAVLAFFGAPIAHEDDPTRAIRAGLDIIDGMGAAKADILDRYGVPIDVRVGINTGLVVVGEVGSDLRVEYTALGDAINVAARMEQTAEPGTIQVSERTFDLTHDAFVAEDLGLVEVKGKADPIRTYRPTAYVGGATGIAEHGLFGRDAELERLMETRRRLDAGTGFLVSLIGEAGLGKSALLREWERRSLDEVSVARTPSDEGAIAAMTGASQSYDASKPLSGFRNVLERWFAFDGVDDFDKIVAATTDIDFPDLPALLGHVTGIDLPDSAKGFVDGLEPPVLLGRARAAVVAYITAEAQRRPLIVAFEDLHWSDDLTVDLIADLLPVTDSAPVGLVFAMRPYRDDPSWRVHERAERDHSHRYQRVDLTPLADESVAALLTDLVGELDLDEDELGKVLERSAGNPLFVEEIASSLGGGGTIEGVPDSLSGVLAARLDRLDERARLVAQVSSVLGTEFRRDTIAALVTGEDLSSTITELLREGVFIESRNTPGRLQFRHALLQDAAYESVLLKTRRRLHGEVASHLEAVTPDDVQDIARHFVAAEDFEQAFPHLVAAGNHATRAMALADAIRDFKLALDKAPADADAELLERAHVGLGEAYALLPDLSESAAAFQRLFEYGEREERPTAQVAALNHLGFTTATVGGDLAQANEYLKQAKILAEKVGDERGLIEYHMNACMVASFDGDPMAAVEHDQKTAELGEALGDDRIRVEGLRRRAMNQALVLDFDQSQKSLELALAAADALGSERLVAELQVLGGGLVQYGRGQYHDCIETISAQLDVLERFASFDLPISHAFLASCHLELGAIEASLASSVETIRTAEGGGQTFTANLGRAGMASVYAIAGLDVEANRRLAETVVGQGPMGDYFASMTWYDVALARHHLGDPEGAIDAYNEGLAAPAVTQYLDRTRLLAGLASALVDTGDLERAETILAEADEFLAVQDFHAHDAHIALSKGRLETASGSAAAKESLTTALAIADNGELRWVGLQAAWALVAVDALPAEAASGRAEAIASGIIDETLGESFLSRWSDPAKAAT